MSINEQLLQLFVEEALETLVDFEQALLLLESLPDDKELTARLFRCVHTLKGNSRILGLEKIERFSHELESLLNMLRNGKLVVTPSVTDTLLLCLDVLKDLVADVSDGGNYDVARYDAALRRVTSILREHDALVHDVDLIVPDPELATRPSRIEMAISKLPPELRRSVSELAHRSSVPAPELTNGEVAGRSKRPSTKPVAKTPAPVAARPMSSAAPVETASKPASAVPMEAVSALPTEPLITTSPVTPGAKFLIDPVIPFVTPVMVTVSGGLAPAEAPSTSGQPQAPAPVEAAPSSAARAPASTVAQAPASPAQAPVSPVANAAVAARPAQAAEPKKDRKAVGDAESSSVRVPIDKLDRLINLTGEVVIAQSIIAQLVTDLTPDRVSLLQEVVAQMDRHCRELQERMLGARMLPLRNVFTRFQRLVRDLAGTTGKSLRLEVSGEETELDKTVIEKIADPLTHIIRNAVDHGIETPEERALANKPAQACVKLEAYQKGGNIFIEVSDDGRGINRDKVLAKAQSSGLVKPGAQLSDDEIHMLLFHPGFSTADKVTELSGRGVGMDVVKRNVEALKGSVTISTKLGEGTTFRIKLPLTLAILDGLGLRVGTQIYLMPLVAVVESLQPKASEVHVLPEVGEVVDVRGEYLPLVRLHRIFDIEPTFEQPEQGLVMVLDDGTQKIALQIDELLGQYQVVIKSLETNFQAIPGVAGATVLGDGRVALILDASNLRTLRPRSEQMAEITDNDSLLTASESAA